jgi:hypothetical protein
VNEARILEIERRLNSLGRQLEAIAQKLTAVQQEARLGWMQPWTGRTSDPAGIYYIDAVVISAGGNVTGKTVYYLAGGTQTTATTNGTIYNKMASATVSTSGKTIIVGPNGDGTYIAISQSC